MHLALSPDNEYLVVATVKLGFGGIKLLPVSVVR